MRFDLRGRQRTSYLRQAAACCAAGLAPAVFQLVSGRTSLDDLAAPAIWALLMSAIAAYYGRVAYGWVHAGQDGLRTSRLLRGRRMRWRDIAVIDSRTWYGKGSSVTVARVRMRSGRTYYLPAPRTTIAGTEAAFDRQLRRLSRRAGRTDRAGTGR